MLRSNLSLLLVCACAISAQANISTNFSDVAAGRSATILGSTPGFQATFGAGINGDNESSAGNIISSIGNNTDVIFFDPGSTSAFAVQRGTAGATNAYIRFDDVLAQSVSLNVVTSSLGDTVDNVSTGAAELEIRAFDSSTQLIDLSFSSFPVSGSTYNFTSADTGIRLLQLRLIGTDTARYVSTITSFSATATPEPSSMALLGLAGLSGAAVRRYRRRRIAKAE
ncbi:PEP-CTERM sorting domain-containing protein [Rosistilla oblonga]|uniref:PEP-CTERM sorting domain-containing protein n=1 Tax=Rosistilla oblonga TaxID=2527990 RepID=UPI003A983CF8